MAPVSHGFVGVRTGRLHRASFCVLRREGDVGRVGPASGPRDGGRGTAAEEAMVRVGQVVQVVIELITEVADGRRMCTVVVCQKVLQSKLPDQLAHLDLPRVSSAFAVTTRSPGPRSMQSKICCKEFPSRYVELRASFPARRSS
jgi:hypothetical protein